MPNKPNPSANPAEPSAALAVQFKAPFAEQVAFFRQKLGNLVPTAKWDDLWHAQHDKGFMVAGAAKADLLADLAGAVDKAIASGESLDAFRKRFTDIVGQHGWHGWTGEGTKAGQDWRTRIIYQTNLSASYSAGRLAQLRAGGYSHYMYKHADSVLHPRPHHVALNGVVEPADSAFWQTHYPPNGWGCHCRVVGVRNPAQATRLGGDWGKQAPDWASQIDAKTGEPVGVDKGWGYMPGGTVSDTVRALTPKLNQLPPKPSVALIQDWLKSEAFARWFAAPQGAWPLVRLPDADALALGAADGVRVASVSEATAAKQLREHPELTASEYAQAQGVIDAHTAKDVQDNVTASGEKTGTKSMVYVQEDTAGGYVIVVKATLSGQALWVTSYRRLSRDAALREREISRLLLGAKRK